jgi:hypothetical protein
LRGGLQATGGGTATRGPHSSREIASLIASLQSPVQPQFHSQSLAPHSPLYLFTLDLMSLPGEGKCVVFGDEAIPGRNTG